MPFIEELGCFFESILCHIIPIWDNYYTYHFLYVSNNLVKFVNIVNKNKLNA